MTDLASRLHALFGNCLNSGPVSLEVIAAAEKKLGLLFPPSYRTFLERYGASMGDGFEIYGLTCRTDSDEMPQWSDVIEHTLSLRPDCLPENSVEISHDGSELGYCLQSSPSDPGYEGPVIEWGPVHDGGKVCAESFMQFVEWYCAGRFTQGTKPS
ncbi:MAG: SMI1/KNR4 family protein [Pirellulaceae bacterium]|nr:SMI1/KNR4 family protein [Pirellulaceae bacterium]